MADSPPSGGTATTPSGDDPARARATRESSSDDITIVPDDDTSVGGPGTSDGADAVARRGRWWVEVLLILGFYIIYSAVRNQFGSASASPEQAFDNAVRIIDIEKAMGLYHEESIQAAFVDHRWFMQAWNVFYGTFHFVVTAGALLWIFLKHPNRYPRTRNSLAATTALAIIGFSTFPLMPPRLLAVDGKYGGAAFGGERYTYIDSLAEFGGTWSFDSGAMQEVSNQFAAMPSLHFGWSAWCLLVLWPVLRSRLAKAAIALYPVATLFAIVVTANHYWIDAVGGAIVLGVGWVVGGWIARVVDRVVASRRTRSDTAPAAL